MTLPDRSVGTPASPPSPAREASGADSQTSGRRDLWNELDQSSIMSVELIAAILTWGGAGWLLDRWLGTTPVLFGVGVMLGFAAGLYLVWYRSGKDQEYPDGARSARRDETTEGR